MKRPAAAIYAIAIAVSISPLAMAQKSGSHTGSCTSSTSTTSSASTAASASGAASRGALSTASSNVSVPYSARRQLSDKDYVCLVYRKQPRQHSLPYNSEQEFVEEQCRHCSI